MTDNVISLKEWKAQHRPEQRRVPVYCVVPDPTAAIDLSWSRSWSWLGGLSWSNSRPEFISAQTRVDRRSGLGLGSTLSCCCPDAFDQINSSAISIGYRLAARERSGCLWLTCGASGGLGLARQASTRDHQHTRPSMLMANRRESEWAHPRKWPTRGH